MTLSTARLKGLEYYQLEIGVIYSIRVIDSWHYYGTIVDKNRSFTPIEVAGEQPDQFMTCYRFTTQPTALPSPATYSLYTGPGEELDGRVIFRYTL